MTNKHSFAHPYCGVIFSSSFRHNGLSNKQIGLKVCDEGKEICKRDQIICNYLNYNNYDVM